MISENEIARQQRILQEQANAGVIHGAELHGLRGQLDKAFEKAPKPTVETLMLTVKLQAEKLAVVERIEAVLLKADEKRMETNARLRRAILDGDFENAYGFSRRLANLDQLQYFAREELRKVKELFERSVTP